MTEIELFLDHLGERDLTKETLSHYRVALTDFFEWFTQATGQPGAAAWVTPLDLRQYREALKEKYKAATVNGKLGCLSAFFDWGVETGRIPKNPVSNLKRVTLGTKAPKWLTRQETYKVLQKAEQMVQIAQMRKLAASEQIAARTQAMVLLMLNAGLRASEVANLKVADIKLTERAGLVLVRYGKGDKEREVPLNLDARRAVQTWLKVRGSESVYLFPGADETQPLSRLLVTFHVTNLGEKAGVKLHPHRLRHTFGKNLIDRGVPLDRVAMLMGHVNLNTTALYTLPGESDLRQAVDKIAWED